jgi:hypothetical protein
MESLSSLCFSVICSTENFIQLNGDAVKRLPMEVIQRLLNHMIKSIQCKLIEQTIALKIRLIRQNRLVTFRFSLHAPVSEAVRYIYDRVGDGKQVFHTILKDIQVRTVSRTMDSFSAMELLIKATG